MSKLTAYSIGATTTPLKKEAIGRNLFATVQQYPENLALVDVQQDVRLTYREFWDLTTKVAKALLKIGLKKGDRIGICTPNRYEWTAIQYASSRIGVILVNLNPAYQQCELEFAIKDSELKVFFTVESFKKSNYRLMLEELQPICESLNQVVYINRDWDDFIADNQAISDNELENIEASVDSKEPINIQYTSGTTGVPKGVTLTHFNILNNAFFIGERLQYTAKDSVCIPLPLFHCFGMVIGNLACTSHGSAMIYPGESFDAHAVLTTVEKERCTSLYGVPTMFIAELNAMQNQTYDLSSLRTGVMSGTPCPEEIMKQVKEQMHLTEITVCYGMTETSPVSTQTKIHVPIEKQVGTVGTVMDHVEIKIIDKETGELLPKNSEGEICTRGYSVMAGYWNNPTATKEVIDAEGWMHTGDLGFIDSDEYLVVSGRIKDLIIRGGENISPREIEEFLYKNPNVEEVQIIGLPDFKYGEIVMAWVKPKEGKILTEEELIQFCKGKIAHYKIPQHWKFVDQFPMTASGKVRKIEMREISIKELGL